MMPGTLLAPLPSVEPVAIREGVEVFGGPDPSAPVRVEVQVRACLSFAELLGLLTFAGSLTYDELSDDTAIRDTLQFAVLDSDVRTMEHYGSRAMAAYHGVPGPRDVDAVHFVRCLAVAVTRVFGVAA